MKPLLKLDGVTASYGASQALFGVDLEVGEGEVVALMGRNGMGKTTTVRTICALLRPREGAITFDGAPTRGLAIHRSARLGIGLVPEGRRCFAPLTVEENLTAAARPGEWTQARVETLFPRLRERRAQTASTLSGGEQQMLAIGRALMTNPRLLILDEATEGLAPVVRQEIWAALHELKGSGLSILVIDKSLKELSRIADRAVMLERGRTVWAGATAALTPEIADQYLGLEMAFVYPQRVRFQHCDPAGIVFFPRYFEMLKATVEEWFAERLRLPFAELRGEGQGGVPTRAIRAEFPAPSRLGDMLDWLLVPVELGASSCRLSIGATCAGAPRASFEQTIVWVDMGSGRPRPWPEALRARIEGEMTEGNEA